MSGGATPVRTRFAPSPTGVLHVGAVRTALFAWLAARHTGGQFVLRIEDTDQDRYVPGSEAQITESLAWLGLDWDEGPEIGGPHAPYIQSQRQPIYERMALELADSGAAYWCTCTPERLEGMRAAQRASHKPTRYDRRCLARADEVRSEREQGVPSVLRLRMPEGRTEWDDVVHGVIGFDNAEIDDQVLLKADRFPTYHLAVVIDDHLMEISHVIRADEWLPSTPKHLVLYAAFGWEPPRFAHVPNVLQESGGRKLSKRRGARNVLEYGELGYVPEALVNCMALLGWSSGTEQEFFTPPELVQAFTLERVQSSPAVFDPRRLDDLNGLHIRALPEDRLVDLLEFHLPSTSKPVRRAWIPLLRERMVTLRDATSLCGPLLSEVEWGGDVEFPPRKVSAEIAAGLLDQTLREVEANGLEDVEAMRFRLTEWLEQGGVKARDGFRVLYIAMFGRPVGLPVFDAMRFVGDVVTSDRLRSAHERLTTTVSLPSGS